MPTYMITDNQTGRKFKVSGDSPPSESEMMQIFADMGGSKSSRTVGNPNASPAETEAMRRKFVADEGTLTTRVKDYFTAQTPAAESPADFATRVVPESAGRLIPRTLAAAYMAMKGQTAPIVKAFTSERDNPNYRPGEEMRANALGTVRGVADFVTAPTGLLGLDRAKEAWTSDPAGSLLAVSPLIKPTARGVVRAPESVLSATSRLSGKAANKLTEMTLKQPTTNVKPEVRAQNVKVALEEGYLPNAKGVENLNTIIAKTEAKLAEGISAGDAAGVKGTLKKAISNIEALREKANLSSDPAKNNALIDAEIVRLKNHPLQEGFQPVQSFKEFSQGKMGKYMKEEGGHGPAMQRIAQEYKEYKSNANTGEGEIPIADIQQMKVTQGRELQKTYGEEKPQFQNTIDKARVRGLKEELESALDVAFPELAATNKKLGEYYNLKKALERAANRISNNQGIGIGAPIKAGSGAAIGGMLGGVEGAAIGSAIGTMIGVIEHPAVAPRLARQLYKASKGTMTYKQALAKVRQRIADISFAGVSQKQDNPQ